MNMNFEEFKEKVAEELKNYLGAGYENVQVMFKDAMKVNRTVEQLSIMGIPGHENASPSIPIEAVYEDYFEKEDFGEVMEHLAGTIKQAVSKIPSSPINNGLDFSNAEKNIFFTLVNTEQNQELLETVPHREFEDLSIVYRWNVGGDGDGLYTNIVNNDFAKQLGKTEEELFELAKENTKTLFPVTIQNMNEVIADMMFPGTPIDDEMRAEFEATVAEVPDERAMYVISNKAKIFGAASMLYEEKLHDLAEKLNSNLYILPSSVHECIAISDKCGPVEELADMVYEINMEQVEIGERLSNQVYHYDRDERKVSLATDTPNKSLDNDDRDISNDRGGR
jgi:hypothetical protein